MSAAGLELAPIMVLGPGPSPSPDPDPAPGADCPITPSDSTAAAENALKAELLTPADTPNRLPCTSACASTAVNSGWLPLLPPCSSSLLATSSGRREEPDGPDAPGRAGAAVAAVLRPCARTAPAASSFPAASCSSSAAASGTVPGKAASSSAVSLWRSTAAAISCSFAAPTPAGGKQWQKQYQRVAAWSMKKEEKALDTNCPMVIDKGDTDRVAAEVAGSRVTQLVQLQRPTRTWCGAFVPQQQRPQISAGVQQLQHAALCVGLTCTQDLDRRPPCSHTHAACVIYSQTASIYLRCLLFLTQHFRHGRVGTCMCRTSLLASPKQPSESGRHIMAPDQHPPRPTSASWPPTPAPTKRVGYLPQVDLHCFGMQQLER